MSDTTIPAPPAKGTLGLIRHGWHRARTSLLWMVVVAFVFRLGLIVIGHTYRFRPDDNHFSFGWEMGSIGRSLALGQGFSNPFGESTGSTAWEPPLYPFLIAAVFRVFGVYTRRFRGRVAGDQQHFFFAHLDPDFLDRQTIVQRKRRGVERMALGAGAIRHVLVYTLGLGDQSGSTLAHPDFLAGAGHRRPGRLEAMADVRPALGCGCAHEYVSTGVSARCWPMGLDSPLQNAAGVRSLEWFWQRRVFVASIAPWMARDYRRFGRFIFIRSNFGAELRIGNGPNADGTWQQYLHPTQDLYEMRRYREMGEMAYVAARKQEAMAFIRRIIRGLSG